MDVQGEVSKRQAERQWYLDLIRSQESLANRDPVAYRRKVLLLGVLGYAYIFGVLLLVVSLLIGLVWLMTATGRGNTIEVKIGFVLLLLIVSIVRSLFVKFEEPDGVPLSREEAPQLYATVDAIADRLQAPRPDEIRVNEDLNAAALQHPRLGLFGWYRNILYLGLPLMFGLSPEEMRAVIAHEFGHFSGAHGKFGAWAYRLDMTWKQLLENMSRRGHGNWLIVPFFNWFFPRFAATSFALRRANEYEADAAAASVSGPVPTSRSLMRLRYLEHQLGEGFWKPFYERSKRSPSPPDGLFQQMETAMRPEYGPEIRSHLVRGLSERTDYEDTHPSLPDRLKALRVEVSDIDREVAELSKPIEANAAEVLFGKSLPAVLAKVEAAFTSQIAPKWKEAYEQYQLDARRLSELESMPLRDEQQDVEYAVQSYRLRETADVLPLIRTTCERYPDNATATLLLGQALAETNDPDAPSLLEKAVELNRDFADPVREILAVYHRQTGDDEKVEALRQQAYEDRIRDELDYQTAMKLDLKADLLPPMIDADTLRNIEASLGKVPRLQVAFLVSRILPATGRDCHYLIVYHRRKFIESEAEKTKIGKAVSQAIPSLTRTLIISPEPRKKWLKRLAGIQGARIFGQP